MDEQLSPVAVTHLLQHTLRSLCTSGDDSQWVYAVFWRILPRNYPPPKWDLPGGAYDRTRGNRRNWILAWEDGFCNFAATSAACGDGAAAAVSAYAAAECEETKQVGVAGGGGGGLQPELFFKMSHDIYNYGEGLIGKVAADHSHKWVFKEPQEQEINLISSWSNPADSHPRTWEAQFQSGIQASVVVILEADLDRSPSRLWLAAALIKALLLLLLRLTIALIAVREGVVQLGSMKKVHHHHHHPLEALLSKLPSVVPAAAAPSPPPGSSSMPPTGAAASSAPPKEEAAEDDYVHCHGMDMATSSTNGGAGESTGTGGGGAPLPSSYFVNVGVKPSEGF
uniref:Transcription factor MYC/MYB N-terminal domain-containing protein n=1 Tax=Oryza meridionalis TaxID=40149 RepID=A0A0E0DZJ0_9ORYZ